MLRGYFGPFARISCGGSLRKRMPVAHAMRPSPFLATRLLAEGRKKASQVELMYSFMDNMGSTEAYFL